MSANYFQYLGWSIPTILVAVFIWYYHLRIAEEESTKERYLVSVRRVHYYLMSVLGLGTLIAGLIIMLGIPLDSIISSLDQQTVVVEQGWWNNHLSLSLAMLAVSIPIWLYYWSRIIDMAEKDGADERPARSRRIYLYVIIGASVVMLAADLVNIVYQLLNGVLTGDLGNRHITQHEMEPADCLHCYPGSNISPGHSQKRSEIGIRKSRCTEKCHGACGRQEITGYCAYRRQARI